MTDAAAAHLRAENTEALRSTEQKLSIASALGDAWGPQAARQNDVIKAFEQTKGINLPLLDLVLEQHSEATHPVVGDRASNLEQFTSSFISHQDNAYVHSGILPAAGYLLNALESAQKASTGDSSNADRAISPGASVHPTVVGGEHHPTPCGTGKHENDKWHREEEERKRRAEAESKLHPPHDHKPCGTGKIENEKWHQEEEARKRRAEAENKLHPPHEHKPCGTSQIEENKQRAEREERERQQHRHGRPHPDVHQQNTTDAAHGGDKPHEGPWDAHPPWDKPKPHSLDIIEARDWYNDRIKEIEKIEMEMRREGKPLEEIARKNHALRNQLRQDARDAMSDREQAEGLDVTNPLKPFEYYYQKYNGDYEKIIEKSKTTNHEVNQAVEEERKKRQREPKHED